MTKAQTARNQGTSKSLVSYLVNNKRKTTNIQLAIAVAKLTGRRPVEFISDKIKPLALMIYPKLSYKYRIPKVTR
jgi:hypothetical protein